MHIGDNIVKFSANDDGIYLSKLDKNIFRKANEEKKGNIVEGLKKLKTVGENKKVSHEH